MPILKDNLDIIEIDAASNRRIDEIRDLREKIATTPVEGKYKVYIIDEVHMLTREAFNALLKTLEEPPAHIVFILATTEAHKLPETIISRTQRFEFRPVSVQQAAKHLADIAKKEKIKASPEALEMLAEFGAGSPRIHGGRFLENRRSGRYPRRLYPPEGPGPGTHPQVRLYGVAARRGVGSAGESQHQRSLRHGRTGRRWAER